MASAPEAASAVPDSPSVGQDGAVKSAGATGMWGSGASGAGAISPCTVGCSNMLLPLVGGMGPALVTRSSVRPTSAKGKIRFRSSFPDAQSPGRPDRYLVSSRSVSVEGACGTPARA